MPCRFWEDPVASFRQFWQFARVLTKTSSTARPLWPRLRQSCTKNFYPNKLSFKSAPLAMTIVDFVDVVVVVVAVVTTAAVAVIMCQQRLMIFN